jgi:hypothetical protein
MNQQKLIIELGTGTQRRSDEHSGKFRNSCSVADEINQLLAAADLCLASATEVVLQRYYICSLQNVVLL